MATDPIRVMLGDDEEAILDTLSLVVRSEPGMDLVGTAHDCSEAIELARSVAPDVALVDVRMPGGGAKAAREIRRLSPGTRVIAFSGHHDPDTVVSMLRAGATGYVAKDEGADQLLRAIHRSAEGRASISVGAPEGVAERLAEYQAHRTPRVLREPSRRIQEAIDGDILHMVFQPMVALSNGRVVGVEALARFGTTPRRSPDSWFAEAARLGLLTELELAAIELAVEEIEGLAADIYLSVNVSPRTLTSRRLAELLEVSPERIVVEVTEQSPVDSYEELIAAIRPLREMGVRIAIDDVGAGFASLRHVIRLLPEFVKVDRELVQDLDSDPVRRALIARLASFFRDVGISMVAEGIETEEVLGTLRTLGVPFGQGFHLGRPGPLPVGTGHRAALRWPGRHAFRRPR